MKNKILSWAIALLIAYVFVKLIFMLFKITITLFVSVATTLITLVLMAVFALPVYVIVRKKLFPGK